MVYGKVGMALDRVRTLVNGFLSAEGPVSPAEERNFRYLCLEAAWWGVALGTYQSYLAVFATRLGASNFWIGVLSSGPALVSIFWLLPAGRLVERQTRHMPILGASLFLARSFIALMVLVPCLLASHAGEALVILVVLQAIPTGLATVALTTTMADALQRERLGQVVSRRSAIVGITSTLGTLASVPLLAWLPVPVNYQVVFAIGFVAAIVSTYYVSRLKVPDRSAPPPRPSRRRFRRPTLSWKAMRDAWKGQPAYNWFVVAAFVFHWAIFAGVPLYPIYWIRELHLSDTWISVVKVAFSGGSVMGALAAPRLIRRWGNGRLLTYSAAAISIWPIGMALSRSPYPLVLVAIVGGLVSGPMGVSLFNRLIEVVPAARRASYVGLYSAITSVAVFAAPLVSTTLISYWQVSTVLAASGGLRLVGGLLFALSRGEASELPDSSPMGEPVAESPGGTS